VDAAIRTFRAAALFLGIALLCGCAAPRTAARPEEPNPVSVRLPVITPLKIEPLQAPPGSEPSISPTEVEEGRSRSLRMIQIDYDLGKAGPAVEEAPPGSTDTEPKP
jgi:hypothetical protein